MKRLFAGVGTILPYVAGPIATSELGVGVRVTERLEVWQSDHRVAFTEPRHR